MFFSPGVNTYIDVTETIDLKGKGLLCHATQFSPDSDIPKRVKERAEATAKEAKEKLGLDMQYAESFRRIKLYIPEENKAEGEAPGIEEKVKTN
jgi:LmbE family N-acetylglucosaminyl deacetylase